MSLNSSKNNFNNPLSNGVVTTGFWEECLSENLVISITTDSNCDVGISWSNDQVNQDLTDLETYRTTGNLVNYQIPKKAKYFYVTIDNSVTGGSASTDMTYLRATTYFNSFDANVTISNISGNVEVDQADPALLNATIYQSNASSLLVTPFQSNASNLLVTPFQSNASNLVVTSVPNYVDVFPYSNNSVTETGVVVKGSSARLYGFSLMSTSSSVNSVIFYDQSTVPVAGDTANVILFQTCRNDSQTICYFPRGREINFSNGLAIRGCNGLSIGNTGSIGSNVLGVILYYV